MTAWRVLAVLAAAVLVAAGVALGMAAVSAIVALGDALARL